MNKENDFERIQNEYLECKKKSSSFWEKRVALENWYNDKITLISRYYQETDKYVKPENITSLWEFYLSLAFDYQEVKVFLAEKGFDAFVVPTKGNYIVRFQF